MMEKEAEVAKTEEIKMSVVELDPEETWDEGKLLRTPVKTRQQPGPSSEGEIVPQTGNCSLSFSRSRCSLSREVPLSFTSCADAQGGMRDGGMGLGAPHTHTQPSGHVPFISRIWVRCLSHACPLDSPQQISYPLPPSGQISRRQIDIFLIFPRK